MPSQEDYLDNLLKDVGNEIQNDEPLEETTEELPGESGKEVSEFSVLDEVAVSDESKVPDLGLADDLSEEEVDRLLSGAEDNGAASDIGEELFYASDMDMSDEDVLKLLAESDDADMQELHNLLEKAENHEPVEEEQQESVLEEERNMLTADLSEVRGRNVGKQERAEKKKKRQEEKGKKRKEQEDRRAEKKAKREERRMVKEDSSAEKLSQMESGEGLFDKAVLDSIVSKADRMGRKDGENLSKELLTEENEQMPVFSDSVFAGGEDDSQEPSLDFPAEESTIPKSVFEEVAPEETSVLDELVSGEDGKVGIGDLGLDIGSLFGDSDTEESLMSNLGDSAEAGMADLLASEEDGSRKESLDAVIAGKKKGLFSRIADFLTEEEEEDLGNEDLNLSQENKDILKDLDKEAAKKKKVKKSRKTEPEKAEKKKAKAKKEKPQKEPKPKKEKLTRGVISGTDRKLSAKKVLPIVAVGISLGVLLFVFVNASVDYSDKKTARAAYYEGDYQTCYLNLFGKELDETESVMYGKSASILYIRLWLREFEMFAEEGDMVRALDSLIQTVDRYPQLYEYANQWNAGAEVAAGYATVLNYLSVNFDLTEAQAQQIAAIREDVDYTRAVTGIVEGKHYEEWEQSGQQEMQPEDSVMEDVLPEEEGLGEDTFM